MYIYIYKDIKNTPLFYYNPMELAPNVDFINRINTAVKTMMKDGKIDQYDIPAMVLLVTELITSTNTSKKSTLTPAQLEASINTLYDYIMTHYNLFPAEEEQKANFKRVFEMCVQLALFQPNVTKACKNFCPCVTF